MFNSLNTENIITKSQMYEQMLPDKILGDSFAKTVSYHGIQNNFCLDIPEILEEEQRQQEHRNDIAKFTKLAMSDIENITHNKLVEENFTTTELDAIFGDNIISSLSTNEQLLNDLGLL
ncbi:MAG: hypothetical protein NC200_06225 [Candidatus Gastranaerophilales bacterium]|nr:hypothetical protein [Candidatus Gastranaerophilales bacterium]